MSSFVWIDYQAIILNFLLLLVLFCINVVWELCSKIARTNHASSSGFQRRVALGSDASPEFARRLGRGKNQELANGLTCEMTLLVFSLLKITQVCICSKDTVVFAQVSKDHGATNIIKLYANLLILQISPSCQMLIRYNHCDFPFTALAVLTFES